MNNRNYYDEFQKHGYLIVEKLIQNPENIKSEIPKQRGILKYHKNNFTHTPEEHQVPGAVARYNIPQYKDLYYYVKNQLEHILNISLYPTYYFDRFYFVGQQLKRHIDRPACEISVTLQISTNSREPWPIWFQTWTGEENYAILNDGDAVIYKGCELEHWRNPLKSRYSPLQNFWRRLKKLPDDTYHHQIFLHYVDANGYNLHHAYDACN